MAIIDPKELDVLEKTRGIEKKEDANGNVLAWKGPHSPHWFDNYTECLRENQNAWRIARLKSEGRNEFGQNKQEEEAFKKKTKLQQVRKEKAEAALLAAAGIEHS